MLPRRLQGGTNKAEEKKPGMWEALMSECLKSPAVWLLAIAYFFVYVVRQVSSSLAQHPLP